MSFNHTNADALPMVDIFDAHLAEIALDWVRESPEPALASASSWSPAAHWLSFLEESQTALIDLTNAAPSVGAELVEHAAA